MGVEEDRQGDLQGLMNEGVSQPEAPSLSSEERYARVMKEVEKSSVGYKLEKLLATPGVTEMVSPLKEELYPSTEGTDWWNKPKDDGIIMSGLKGLNQGLVLAPIKLGAEVLALGQEALGVDSQYGRDLADLTEAVMRHTAARTGDSKVKYASGLIGQGVGSLMTMLVPGMAFGKGAMGAALLATSTGVGAEEYAKLKRAGYNTTEAAAFGIGYGGAEAVFEYIGAGKLLRLLKGPEEASAFMTKIAQGLRLPTGKVAQGAAVEGGSELLTEVVQAEIDHMTLNPDMTWAEVTTRLRDALFVGAAIGGGIGGLSTFIETPSERKEKERTKTKDKLIDATMRQTGEENRNIAEKQVLVAQLDQLNSDPSFQEDERAYYEEKLNKQLDDVLHKLEQEQKTTEEPSSVPKADPTATISLQEMEKALVEGGHDLTSLREGEAPYERAVQIEYDRLDPEAKAEGDYYKEEGITFREKEKALVDGGFDLEQLREENHSYEKAVEQAYTRLDTKGGNFTEAPPSEGSPSQEAPLQGASPVDRSIPPLAFVELMDEPQMRETVEKVTELPEDATPEEMVSAYRTALEEQGINPLKGTLFSTKGTSASQVEELPARKPSGVKRKIDLVLKAIDAEEVAAESLKERGDLTKLKGIGKLLGIKVRYFKREKGGVGGFFSHVDPETVWINVATKQGALAVFGHETLHLLRNRSPRLFGELVEQLKGKIDPEAFAAFRKGIRKVSMKEGVMPPHKRAMLEEFIANTMGNEFMKEEFLLSLQERQPGLFSELLKIFNAILKRVQKLAGFPSDFVIKDAKGVRAAFLNFTEKHAVEHAALKEGKTKVVSKHLRTQVNKVITETLPTPFKERGLLVKRLHRTVMTAFRRGKVSGAIAQAEKAISTLLKVRKTHEKQLLSLQRKYEKKLTQLARIMKQANAKRKEKESLRKVWRREIGKEAKFFGVTVSAVQYENVRTEHSYATLLDSIIRKGMEKKRKAYFNDIKEVLLNVEKYGKKLAPEYMELLHDMASWFDGVKLTQKKRDFLTKFDLFLDKHPDAKMKLNQRGRKLAREIIRLEKDSLGDLDFYQMKALHQHVMTLLLEGKKAQAIIEAVYQKEVEKVSAEITKDAHRLGKADTSNVFDKAQEKLFSSGTMQTVTEYLQESYLWGAATEVAIEIMDGYKSLGAHYKHVRKALQDQWYSYRKERDLYMGVYNEERDLLRESYGPDAIDTKGKVNSFHRIFIHATLQQEGGYERLKAMGMPEELEFQGYHDGLEDTNLMLNDAEMHLYKHMRKVLDSLHTQLDEVFRQVEGEPLGHVENFFPWLIRYDKALTTSEAISAMRGRRTKTAQGFKKSRIINARAALQMNSEDIYLTYLNRATYYIHMEQKLKFVRDITVSRPEYEDEVGLIGKGWMDHYLSVVARNGAVQAESALGRASERLLGNLGLGVLGFRLSPVLKQPLAKITSSALLGKDAFGHDAEFLREKLWKTIDRVSDQMRFRVADDPAWVQKARSRTATTKAEKAWGWMEENAFQGIKATDKLTASNVWYHAYRKWLKENGKDFDLKAFQGRHTFKEGVDYANRIVIRTQGSANPLDIPHMFTHNSELTRLLFRSIFQFQSFVLNEFYILAHDGAAKGLMGKGGEKNWIDAVAIASVFATTGMAEQAIAIFIIASLFSNDEYAKKKREAPLEEFIFESLVGKVPLLSTLNSVYQYHGRTGVPLPDTMAKIVYDLPAILASEASGKTKVKAGVKGLEAFSSLAGVPGAGQVGQIIRKNLPSP